ncbi:NEW3 domain-containing protein [Halomicroarcula sp. GCM10025709]|uniref:NEW3 domain-containing protein n=1 Tax=Halomicroarcula sp. GCM10025709 TaxID=3252669 RepID=UPI003622A8EC
MRNASLVAGTDNTVEAVVSNPTTAPLRDIVVRATDPAGGEQTRRTIATLAAGASETLTFEVRAGDPGDRELTLRTTATDPTGAVSTATHSRPVTVDALTEDVGVRARPTTADETDQVTSGLSGLLGGNGGGALRQQSDEGEQDRALVDVTVTNFGNAPVERVVLTARSTDGAVLSPVGRVAVTDRLAPGESATAQVDLTDVRGVDGIRFVASYRLADRSGEAAVAYGYSARAGNATITGADVTVEADGRLRVDGNLANTGTGELRSAVVRVVPDDRVRPAYPQRNYFVGTVADSEFAPFELTAQADVANASSVTVEVTYTTDGEQVRQTATLPVPEQRAAEATGPSTTVLAVGSAVVAVLAVGVIVLVRRRRR